MNEEKMKRLKAYLCYKYGDQLGRKRYGIITRSQSLKLYQFKFGKIDGEIKYNLKIQKDKIKNTLQGFILRYGEEEGTKKYFEKNKKLSVGIDALRAKGLSEEDILKIRSNHAIGSSTRLEAMINKYGEKEGNRRYAKKLKNRGNSWNLEWTMKRYSLDETAARKRISDLQRRDLNFYISKYGEINGKIKYDIANKKRAYANTKEYYIQKYGTEEGQIKYRKKIKEQGNGSKIEYFILKFGEEEGRKRYLEMLEAKSIRSRNSKGQLEIGQMIYDSLDVNLQSFFYGAPITDGFFINFQPNEFGIKCCIPDIRIKNILIEYDGSYCHSREDVILKDKQKEKLLRDQGFLIYRIPEIVFKSTPDFILQDVVNFIKNNININFIKGKNEN